MFALNSRLLRRRLSAQTSGSARRRARERKQAELTRLEGERLAREAKERRRMEKREAQRQAREELSTFKPWGRAGGGAPNTRGVRYTNQRVNEIIPDDELRGVCVYESLHRSSARRRRRTPLRLREDPLICYSDPLKQAVDNNLRYRQEPDQKKNYKDVLDKMVVQRKKALKDQRKRDMEYERQMQTIAGPWGRPGPGGTIWRNPRDIGLNFNKSMGWTDNEIFKNIKGEHRRQKQTSLTLPQVKREDDSSDKENKPSSIEKLPDIKQHNSKESPKNREPGIETTQEIRKDAQKVRKEEKTNKKLVNNSTRKQKFVKRLPNGERVQRIAFDDSNDNEETYSITVEKKPTPEAALVRLTGGIELVPLLARRRRVGARTLPSSDVTRPLEQKCEWREMLNMEYLKELKHQMCVKSQLKEEKRQNSAEDVIRHHLTWATLWGRPGHGAPQQRGRYARNNLARLLYVPPLAPLSPV